MIINARIFQKSQTTRCAFSFQRRATLNSHSDIAAKKKTALLGQPLFFTSYNSDKILFCLRCQTGRKYWPGNRHILFRDSASTTYLNKVKPF